VGRPHAADRNRNNIMIVVINSCLTPEVHLVDTGLASCLASSISPPLAVRRRRCLQLVVPELAFPAQGRCLIYRCEWR
jgi:hypothetical protein